MFRPGIYVFEETKKSIQDVIEMCIIQHAQMRSVFTFQLTKIPVSTTVKTAKLALTC